MEVQDKNPLSIEQPYWILFYLLIESLNMFSFLALCVFDFDIPVIYSHSLYILLVLWVQNDNITSPETSPSPEDIERAEQLKNEGHFPLSPDTFSYL